MNPFTSHESSGSLTDDFTKELKLMIYKKYNPLIEDFNNIVYDPETEKLMISYIGSLEGEKRILNNFKKVLQVSLKR